ncbi:hypothetical protein M947_06400 [Sulfurimonas hongkongensis]|uniref:Filamentous haemagglutinin FhaB/tRNA nuclease CdiA-like TPS domain-containing protein n=1 Tax=Sulfurimonas hongkongensis TaxID=1172190 RepID=T0JF18_9BACT|nr:GLUG motif-containing protein [Sulfurimonas hongkongensis]EQB39620.1 hypothetical protein M947_06400 [Sulfurimonas hongkongensis]
MKLNQDYKSRFKILKGGKISLVISTLVGVVTLSFAAPNGESVVSGGIVVDRDIANTTNINQSSNRGIINWQSFDVKTNERVNFNMPDTTSSTLNRVLSSSPTKIYGQINSNGQVFLVNQNGIYFSENSKINTAGFTASTLDITNENFLNSNYIFEGKSKASILNLGAITTDNAYTALLAKEVINEGVIQARLGNVELASGEKITLDINGNSLVKLTINKGTLDSLIQNKGLIQVDGGIVYLTTKALDEVLNGVVNNTGVIEANSIEQKDGKIILFAHGGTANIGGTLEAKDGFIETSGKEFSIAENTNVQTGHWLLDPINITIDSSLASTLTGQLVSGDATVTTAAAGTDEGNINVDSSISWSANKLTLRADKDININAALNASATAGLELQYAQTTATGTYNVKAPINLATTGSFSTKKGTDAIKNYTIITTLGAEGSTTTTDLQGIKGGLADNYVLGADIDALATTTWSGGTGWDPLGDDTTKFTGDFDGLGHTISNLFIDRGEKIGLFGYTKQAIIQNVGLLDVDISGSAAIGGLIGYDIGSSIFNAYTTGRISGTHGFIGGLVGLSESSTISKSYATGTVSAGDYDAGGLIGRASNSSISDAYATGAVSGTSYVGGLIGHAGSSSGISNVYATGAVSGSHNLGGLIGITIGLNISNAYATGTVSGDGYIIGGLIGRDQDSTITNVYATGAVSGGDDVGGLVGVATDSSISDSYARGDVSGTREVGGLLGGTDDSIITNVYATGAVSGTDNVGGLIGFKYSLNISNSFWDKETTGQTTSSGGGTGLTTAQMKDTKTFYEAGWNLDTVWARDTNNVQNDGYLDLRALSDFDFNTDVPLAPIYENILNNIIREAGNNNKEIREVFIKENNLRVVSKEDTLADRNDIRLALFPNRFIELINGGLHLPDGLSSDFYMLEEEK